ncbi:lectizyme-like [Condylostylus longicornis]|uniref:lectizyme-like n=1 Tax=Condylostylus longicornis TaxID=2530218 RepID=UPI00244E18BE|nr:lectizyme-like [Condylostylus longicornis]
MDGPPQMGPGYIIGLTGKTMKDRGKYIISQILSFMKNVMSKIILAAYGITRQLKIQQLLSSSLLSLSSSVSVATSTLAPSVPSTISSSTSLLSSTVVSTLQLSSSSNILPSISKSSLSVSTASIRIIGGSDAKLNAAPFIVSLQRGTYDTVGLNKSKHGCSGSIITKNVILTAAHCLKSNNLTDIYAIRRVKFYIRHENFTTWNYSGPNDIALLFLEKSFELNEKISIIKLSNTNEQNSLGSMATLYGWGSKKINTNGIRKDRTNILQMITTNLLTYEKCHKLLPNNKRLHSTNICTGNFNQPSIACFGDSGGPLVQESNDLNGNKFIIQIGIVSWGYRICGLISKPSIYTYTGTIDKGVNAAEYSNI